MPASPDTFTITCNGIGALGIDYVDAGIDPDEDIVYAFVYFKPRLPKGTTIWASGLTPPRGIQLDDVKARFSPEDGKLRTIVAQPTNEKQIVTVTGNPFTLTYASQTTSSLASTATAIQVETALGALSSIGGEENVNVSGVNGGPFNVFFTGALGGTDVAQMTATNATITTATTGAGNLGVKLVANTALLNLDELIYDVEFEVPESDRIIDAFAITAPTTTGQTIALETVTKLPHRGAL